jgi:hypothetical protein
MGLDWRRATRSDGEHARHIDNGPLLMMIPAPWA